MLIIFHLETLEISIMSEVLSILLLLNLGSVTKYLAYLSRFVSIKIIDLY